MTVTKWEQGRRRPVEIDPLRVQPQGGPLVKVSTTPKAEPAEASPPDPSSASKAESSDEGTVPTRTKKVFTYLATKVLPSVLSFVTTVTGASIAAQIGKRLLETRPENLKAAVWVYPELTPGEQADVNERLAEKLRVEKVALLYSPPTGSSFLDGGYFLAESTNNGKDDILHGWFDEQGNVHAHVTRGGHSYDSILAAARGVYEAAVADPASGITREQTQVVVSNDHTMFVVTGTKGNYRVFRADMDDKKLRELPNAQVHVTDTGSREVRVSDATNPKTPVDLFMTAVGADAVFAVIGGHTGWKVPHTGPIPQRPGRSAGDRSSIFNRLAEAVSHHIEHGASPRDADSGKEGHEDSGRVGR